MKENLKSILFILILGSISAALLLGARSYTNPIIERYKEMTFKSTVLRAVNIGYGEGGLDEAFDSNIKTMKKGDFVYYLSPAGVYIFEFEGRGLWGMIKGTIALRPDLKTIENIQILYQEETPGLGGRIEEKSFLGQFKNRQVSPRLFLALRQKAAKDNEVDAISGATMTSNALINIINEAVENFRKITGEGYAHN